MLTSIETRKRQLIYIRAMLCLCLVLIGLYNVNYNEISMTAGFVFLAVLIASNFIFIALPARLYRGIRLHYLVFIVDISFVIAGAHIFTGLNIEFIIAVFLALFISALSQSLGFSFLIAVVVNAVYLYIKYISGAEGLTDADFLNLPFIFIVAMHSSYLAEKTNDYTREKLQLEKINLLLTRKFTDKSKELTGTLDFTARLMDGFKSAVIFLDAAGIVRMINKKAAETFGLLPEKTVNSAIKDLPQLGEIREAFMALKFKGEELAGEDMKLSGKEEKFRVSTSFVRDGSEEIIGMLCNAEEAR